MSYGGNDMSENANATASSPFSLKGRVALVTGSSAGLGTALATALGEAGPKVPVERHEDVPSAEKEAYFKLIPAKRWGVPADLGGAVVFLASDAASFITGQNIAVNGGMTVS